MNTKDELLKRLFRESEAQPKVNITEQVMHCIDENPKAFEYVPVISKKAWIIMAGIFSVIMAYLLFNSSGIQFEVPALITSISDELTRIGNSFTLEPSLPSMPEIPQIPTTILISIAALNVIGIYAMISYRWGKSMFR